MWDFSDFQFAGPIFVAIFKYIHFLVTMIENNDPFLSTKLNNRFKAEILRTVFKTEFGSIL